LIHRIHLRVLEHIRAEAAALFRWEMFNTGWTTVTADTAPARPGTNVAVVVRHFGLWSVHA
jgi:hypothetical protein